MKKYKLLCLIGLILWACNAMAQSENPYYPTVSINISPVDANGHINYGEPIEFSTTLTYSAQSDEDGIRFKIVNYKWNFNDPFSSSPTVSGVNQYNPTMLATHTFANCGGYFVTLTCTTEFNEVITVSAGVTTINVPLKLTMPATNKICMVANQDNPMLMAGAALTDNSKPLHYTPTYIWSVLNPTGIQANNDFLVTFENVAINNQVTTVASGNCFINFKKYESSITFPYTFKVQCLVALQNNCKVVASQTVTLNQAVSVPIAFTAASSAVCINSTTQLGAADAGDGTTYAWSSSVPANGTAKAYLSALNIANPVFRPVAGVPASVSYTVTATGTNGCKNTSSVSFAVNTLAANSLPASMLVCKSAALNATVGGGTAPYTYVWNTANANTSLSDLSATNIASPIFNSNNTAGSKIAKAYQVKIIDAIGCQLIKTIYLDYKNSSLSSLPPFSINWCADPHQVNAAQLFTGGSPSYRFNNDATNTAYSNIGAYNFTETSSTIGVRNVTVTDADGCTAAGQYNVTNSSNSALTINNLVINTQSPFLIKYPNLAVVGGFIYKVCTEAYNSLDIDFSISGGCPPYTFSWSYDPQGNSVPNSPDVTSKHLSFIASPNITSTYKLHIVVKDAAGVITSRVVTGVQSERPFLKPTLSNFCNGQYVRTTPYADGWSQNYPSATTTYTWTYPTEAELIESTHKLVLNYTSNKLAPVSLTMTNSCTTYTVNTVYLAGPEPGAVSTGIAKTICPGGSVMLSAQNGSGLNYRWSPVTGLSDPNVQNPVASPTVTTTYTVSNNLLGCSNPYTDNVVVYVNDAGSNHNNVASWKMGFLSSYYTNAVDNVVYDKNANQYFYRTAENNIHSMWWNNEAHEWQWSGLTTINNAAGDLSITPDGQLFYRTTDNKLQSITYGTNGWQRNTLVDGVTNVKGPIVATNGQIFYRTTDNKIQSIYFSGGQWLWSGLNNAGNNVNNAMAYSYADGKIYYRTMDNKLNCMSWSSASDWQNSDLNNIAGSIVDNSIAIAPNGQIFFKTTTGTINSLYKNNGNWGWSGLNYPSNVSGNLVSDATGNIYYTTTNGNINKIYWTSGNGWQTDVLNYVTAQNRTATTNGIVVTGSVNYNNLAVTKDGNIGFKTADGRIRYIYNSGPCQFDNPYTRVPENPNNTITGVKYTAQNNDWFKNCTISGVTSTVKLVDKTMPCQVNNSYGATSDRGSISPGSSTQFTGYIDVPVEGTYAFYTNSDDGSNLYVGNKLIVDNRYGYPQSMTEKSGLIALKAGKHAFTVNFKNEIAGAGLVVSYEGPTTYKQEIPSTALYIVSAQMRTAEDTIKPSITSSNLNIYPNPFDNSFKLLITNNNTNDEPVVIEIFDILGTKVYSIIAKTNTENELFIEGKTGVYIGKASFEDGRIKQFKVIKN